jgi:hypothetical protein
MNGQTGLLIKLSFLFINNIHFTSFRPGVNGQSRYARVRQKVSGKLCVCVLFFHFFVVIILCFEVIQKFVDRWTTALKMRVIVCKNDVTAQIEILYWFEIVHSV